MIVVLNDEALLEILLPFVVGEEPDRQKHEEDMRDDEGHANCALPLAKVFS